MKEFTNKVAVITGAASGIGYAIAAQCIREGMNVVLVDIDQESLNEAKNKLPSTDAGIITVCMDVSKANDVDALAQKTIETFGSIHLLMNNAGVGVVGTIWESTLADWEWVLGVNLWGVIHGVRTFVPLMLEQDTEGHIINTAAMSGFQSNPYNGIYNVSKHGVVTLSETLYHELAQRGAKLKVSVLCPGPVNTQFMTGERNRPNEFHNAPSDVQKSNEALQWEQVLIHAVQSGITPQLIAKEVFNAVRSDRFYIFTHLTQHPKYKQILQTRLNDILQARNPTPPKSIRSKC